MHKCFVLDNSICIWLLPHVVFVLFFFILCMQGGAELLRCNVAEDHFVTVGQDFCQLFVALRNLNLES